jgi:transketolase
MYLRFGRYAVPEVNTSADYRFEIGKANCLREGSDVTLAATGYMVHLALEAAELLEADGISAEVLNFHTIKPLDRDALSTSVSKTGAIVTAEEHSVIGGLGGAVAEALAETCPVPMERVGVNDTFGRSGKVPELLEHFGLTAANIAAKARAAIARKK